MKTNSFFTKVTGEIMLIMKKVFVIILFFASSSFFSCAENTKKSRANSEYTEDAMRQAGVFFMLPDNLRSQEQKELFSKLETALYEGCSLKNGRFEITISKEELEESGIPDIYYYMLKRDIGNLNHMLDTVSPPYSELVVESWSNSCEEYLARKKSLQPE